MEPVDRHAEPGPEPGPDPAVPERERERYPVEPVAPPSDTEVVSRFSPARRAFELIYLVFAVVCGLFILRILLKVLAANTAVAFTGSGLRAAWLRAVQACRDHVHARRHRGAQELRRPLPDLLSASL